MLITIHLIKPLKQATITYQATVLQRSATHMLIYARWERPAVDLGYVVFAPGDQFYEHFYSERWYTIFAIYAADDTPRGWYCNLARPARFTAERIESEDLELDLFISPDRQTILLLDEEEYAQRGLEQHDPPAHRAVMAALDELRDMAARGVEPFAA